MRARIFGLLAFAALPFCASFAQSPDPVIVAATPAVSTSTTTTQAQDTSASFQVVIKALAQLKAANEETLRRQATTLAQLDELEKAAQQIKILTSRN